MRYRLTETMAQLASLHVSREHRRQGVATLLLSEACRLARQDGAQTIYVSATPSESAVGFYLSQGFSPIARTRSRAPCAGAGGIHMILEL